MIISASYKTDIPAFYTDWFMTRLEAGLCRMRNPYGGQLYDISLRPSDVDGFVFWTRNIRPLLPHLERIRQVAPFFVQFTVTNYPRALETGVIAADRALADIRHLAERYGARAVVWRYDPVVLSDLTPAEWHLENFARLADELRGDVDEVVLSFVHVYAKTRRNMDRAAKEGGFAWQDPDDAEKTDLLAKLGDIARARGIIPTLCAQPALLPLGVEAAACIDAKRLANLGGQPFKAPVSGNRPGCFCARAKDIGAYDTCPHGCAYCYATRNRQAAKDFYRDFDQGRDILALK